jgi:hypothetical protein
VTLPQAPRAGHRGDRFSETYFRFLRQRSDIRKRWILRHRNEPTVREVAGQLAPEFASLRQTIPADALGPTIRHAVPEDFAARRTDTSTFPPGSHEEYPTVARSTCTDRRPPAGRPMQIPAYEGGCTTGSALLPLTVGGAPAGTGPSPAGLRFLVQGSGTAAVHNPIRCGGRGSRWPCPRRR